MHAEPYTREETQQILRERAERACKPNTIADKLLTMIAKAATDAGDIRFGFRVLLTAALLADIAQRQTIEAGDIASAVEDENRVRKLKEYEALRDKLLNLKKKHEKD
jgi:Cdc6-like AAA superfamily ATPase